MAVVNTPVLNPIAGSYIGNIDVSISCGTSGATIYYTTDGTTPDATDNEYEDGTLIEVSSTTTIKAIGILAGFTNSSVATSVFVITSEPIQENEKLKRTGAGEPFKNKLLADVTCCDEPDYKFSFGFNPDLLTGGATVEIKVRNGCPNFSWEVTGSDYSFAEATTSARTNNLTAVAEPSGDLAVMSVTDACGTIITALVNSVTLIEKTQAEIEVLRVAIPTSDPDGGAVSSFDEVTLACETEDVDIYYSIDGSIPVPYED